MDQRPMQYLQNEQGSPFNMTGHSAPGGLVPGSPDSFSVEGFARSVDMDAYKSHPLTGDHRPFRTFGQGMMLQDSQRVGAAALAMDQFIRDQNTPWNPVKAGVKLGQSNGTINYNDPCFTELRGTTGPSECDDSGYYGSLVDPSVTEFSVYNDAGSTFDTRSFVGNFSDLQLQNPRGRSHERESAAPKHPPKDAWNQQRLPNPEAATLVCPQCKSVVKTKAELNKHKYRHEKPFLCQVPGCTRKLGFGTTNDLQRHQQSVHAADGIKYRCNEGSCSTKSQKDWPRADNFKQHLWRMHKIALGSDPDLSKYEHRPSASPPQSGTKLDMLSHSSWMGLDQSQSALPDLADREMSFGHLEDRATHLGQGIQQLPGPQETETGPDHVPLAGTREAHHVSQHSLEEERPTQLEMDDTILRGLADHQTPAEELTPASSDDSYSLEGGSICPAALTSTPGLGSTQDERGPASQPDVANHQIQGGPFVQNSHIPGHADMGNPAIEYESQDAADGDDSCDTPSEDDATDGLHAPSESTTSRDESTMHDLKDVKPPRGESNDPSPAVVSSSEDPADNMDIDEREASALVMSFHEKGILDKILSKLGYQKTKEEQDGKSPGEKSTSPSLTYGKESCPDCEKTFKRPCELKKHRKRHEKPYACTQEDCDKKFGSKNDWKRHENSQHIQLEFWRCTEKVEGRSTPCAKICHRRVTFTKHLSQAHGITDADALEKRSTDCRTGRNFESRFWCGFCQQAVEFTQHGGMALSERFDHIDAHFAGKNGKPKMDISEWKSLESEPLATFQEILAEAREPDEAPPSPSEDGSRKRRRAGDDGDGDDGQLPAPLTRKRRYVKLHPTRDSVLWLCCDCGNYWSPAVTTRCMWESCSHSLCGQCDLVVQQTPNDG